MNNSKKTVLARGCDPVLSAEFAKMVPALIGNAKYIPTTNDEDFIEKLKTEKWSVVYFAPGACRFSAVNQRIPGTNEATKAWTLEEYKALILEHQGPDVPVVESTEERNSLLLLNQALENAKETLVTL